jgi:hypothetical protein
MDPNIRPLLLESLGFPRLGYHVKILHKREEKKNARSTWESYLGDLN